MSMYRFNHQQRGVSLVELMIAMLLGLFLMIGVIQVFVSSKSTYTAQESLSRVQESGRHATALLTRDIRMAGYTGCGGQASNFNNRLDLDEDSSEEFIHNFTTGIFGSEASGTGPGDDLDLGAGDPDTGWSPALPDGVGDADIQPLPGSDVFMVRGPTSAEISAFTASGNPIGQAAQFQISGDHSLQPGDIVIVSDCTNTAMLQITNNVDQSDSIANAAGCGQYDPCNLNPATWEEEDFISGDATVARIEASVFFVALDDQGTPALYRQVLSGNDPPGPQAIAEGVENMQILYGMRDGEDISVAEYLTAAEVDSDDRWDDVIAVEMALLVRDEQRVPGGIANRPRTFTLANYELTVGPDGLPRQIFRTRVTLRNRAL